MKTRNKSVPNKRIPTWGIIGDSVCGASHFRTNRSNQDAIKWLPLENHATFAMLSASDGHGGKASFRSATGSRLAAEVATDVLSEFMATSRETDNLSLIKSIAEEKLPPALHRQWKHRVNEHLVKNPLSKDELLLLKKAGIDESDLNFDSHTSIYGSTILSVLVTPSYALLLQLGDGAILIVTDEGEVQRPLPGDPRLFAEETTSLSMNEAWKEFQTCFQVLSNKYPALLLISTDGYINSFPKDDDFHKVGCDILNMIRTGGIEDIKNNLSTWLTEASHLGSGDDITLGVVYRKDIVHNKQIEAEG